MITVDEKVPDGYGADGLALYNGPSSTCSHKVRMVLAEKGLDWEDRRIRFRINEHLTDWYLKINPNAVVPTLIHGDRIVRDSSVINEYLEDNFPQAPLMPADSYGRAKLREWRQFIDEVPTPAIRVPSFNHTILEIWSKLSDEEFETLVEKRSIRRHFYRRMGRTGFPAEDVQAATEQLGDTVGRMEEALAGHGAPWILGADYSLVDISLLPTIVRMADIGLGHLWDGAPHVAAWFERMQARPAFAATYYEGSRYGQDATLK